MGVRDEVSRRGPAARSRWSAWLLALTLLAGVAGQPGVAHAQGVLRAVMNSDLKIIDPTFTTAYITRNHGYLVYDTLFATDADGKIQPQMVDTWTESDDHLHWQFTLRKGLTFHDGTPVTGTDVVASLKRWGQRDTMGQKLFEFIDTLKAGDDPDSFSIHLKTPTGLMLLALGKPSANVPFILPARIAATPPDQQIDDATGSGPYVFVKDEWKPGDRAVYRRFEDYRPRKEAPSGLAGGKVAKIERIEWRNIPDAQTAVNALRNGEIDFIEQPLHDMLPQLAQDPKITLVDANPLGMQYVMRFNVLHKPFDNPKIRAAVFQAFNQEDFLMATIGNEQYFKPCKALFGCGTPLGSEAGMDGLLEGNLKRARAMLEEAGYDGTPVVLLQSTDLATLTNLAPVGKDLLERAGFKVDLQSSDWQSVVTRRVKRDPPAAGGWSAMFTAWATADIMNPVSAAFVNAACDKAPFGWPCDAELQKLRDEFARSTDAAGQKAIADRIQVRMSSAYPTEVWLGQWYQPIAVRRTVSGVVHAPVAVFWNMEVESR